METNYLKQANDFLKSTGTKLHVSYLETGKHFEDDKTIRDIYKVTLKKGDKVYSFNFGQSLQDSRHFYLKAENVSISIFNNNIFMYEDDAKKEVEKIKSNIKLKNPSFKPIIHVLTSERKQPSSYDILTCLTKYDPGTFEDFCGEFGYDTDSRKAEKTYNLVIAEWMEISDLFNEEEMDLLREIN